MALVGDIIVASRSLVPDAAQVLPAPSGLSSSQFAAVPTLAAGSYVIAVTYLTQWGETTALTLAAVTVDGAHGLQVTGTVPIGVTTIRVYYGIGAVNQSQDFTTLPAQVSTPGTANTPPTVNRAYLPDTDGAFIGARTIYQWLNEGLDKATDIAGGILDVTGASSIQNVGMYKMQGNWIKLIDGYFDGFNIYDTNRGNVFRRNPVVAITGVKCRVTISPSTVIELYPQPNRTAAVLQTSGTLGITGTSVSFTTTSGSLLTSFGLILIGGSEIAQYYGTSGGVMSGMTRGLGGTQPQAWPPSTIMNELNIPFGGARRAVKHKVGDSALTILVPPGWESLLPRYIESRARQAEHEWKVAADLMKSFEAEVKAQLPAYKQLAGPCQINTDYWDNTKGDVVGTGIGGGWFVP